MYRYFSRRLPVPARPFAAAAVGTRAAVKLAITAFDGRIYDRAH
jgi:hypothetical protein